MNFVYSESNSLCPSIFYHLSGVWLRGQQPKQGSTDFSLPNNFVQLFPVWVFSMRRRSRDSTPSSGTRQTVAQNTPFDEEGNCGADRNGGRPRWPAPGGWSFACKVTVQRGNMGSPYCGLMACRRGRGHCVGWEPKAESHSVPIKITFCYLKLWFSKHQLLGGTRGCWQKYAFKRVIIRCDQLSSNCCEPQTSL